MGIKGLMKKMPPGAVHRHDAATYFRGKIVFVDANNYIYRLASIHVKGTGGQQINHLQGVMFRCVAFSKWGARSIFVFDGKPPAAKDRVIAARKRARESGGIRVTRGEIEDVKRLLDFLGIEWADATGEAEAQCARWALGCDSATVMTDDLDAIAFGAPEICRIDNGGKVRVINSAEVVGPDGKTRGQDAAIAWAEKLGCDYDATGAELRELFMRPIVASARVNLRVVSRSPDVAEAAALLISRGLNPARVESALKNFDSPETHER